MSKWYRQRSYAHFDIGLSKKNAIKLVEDVDAVSSHSFWPLIVRNLSSVSKKNDGITRKYKKKSRPIAYAAHSDSHIFAYYAEELNQKLEQKYASDLQCNNAVLAYRRFNPPKSNIHFALEAFTFIKKLGDCDVIALDVDGFFDNLDHKILKSAWIELLDLFTLPKDHFAVYRACTRSYGITAHELAIAMKGRVRRRRKISNSAVCTPHEFRSVIKPHIQPLQKLVSEIKKKTY